MKNFVFALLTLFFFACASVSIPVVIPNKGAVYGTLTAQSHSQFLKKVKTQKGDHDYAGGLIFNKNMVNYPNLNDLYACIIDPSYKGGKTFEIIANQTEMSIPSLALSPGDILSIQNSSDRPLTFFLADTEDAFQDLSKINPGETRSFTIKIQGSLELGTDEDENLKTIVFSKNGLRSQQVSSGATYAFEKLEPGNYQMIFWYWRLGKIKRQVQIQAGQNTVLNEMLSVNTVMR